MNLTCFNDHVPVFKKSNLRIVDEKILNIDFIHDLKLTELSDAKSFSLVAMYIDDATNKVVTATCNFKVVISDYIVSVVHSPQFFKPGIPYSFTLLVHKVNGYPVLNSHHPVEVSVHDDNKTAIVSGNYSLDPNSGAVEIVSKGISMNAVNLTIKAKFDKVRYLHVVHKAQSYQKEFISMNVLTPR